MSFYDECLERDIDIPDEYDMEVSEMLDICENAPEPSYIAHFCFEYGFEQGKASKEAELVATTPAKVQAMRKALDSCSARELQLVYFFMQGLGMMECSQQLQTDRKN